MRADHEERYGCQALLKRVFGPKVEVVVLPHETRGPADTVAQTILRARVTGAIAIKDADSFFAPSPLPDTSFVSVSDVRCNPRMTNVGAKSFAAINGEGLIVDMVEKSLASNHVCVGLYGFGDAARFLEAFDAVAAANRDGEVFVSHVMSRAIRDGLVVKPHEVEGLIDVGTLDDWRRYTRTAAPSSPTSTASSSATIRAISHLCGTNPTSRSRKTSPRCAIGKKTASSSCS